ncbi:MAG TPA: sigma-70 family RNA polymerase sigma factor, partial [Chloroflexota bacterium]|nr:sigma-70 family RNA polymerase sigma factor [Chloroflexota bacterium]
MMAVESPSVVELRTQDHRAFGALVDRQYEPVHRYLVRVVGDAEVAAELTQETFCRAYQALPRLADDSNVGGWLFSIATNLARQYHRHRRLISWSRLDADQPETYHAPHQRPENRLEDDVARQELVRHALQQMPLEQRVCLLLYAWTGYTCAEIGEIVGKSTAAVRMLLVRARRRFRSAYGDSLDAIEGPEGTTRPQAQGPARGGPGPGPQAGPGCGPGAAHAGGAPDAGGTTMNEERDACRAVEELLPFYPRGDLRRETFAAVTRHVAACRRCREALAELQATYRLLQRHLNLAEVGDSPEARATIMARLRAPLAAMMALPEPYERQAGPELPVPVTVPVTVPTAPV